VPGRAARLTELGRSCRCSILPIPRPQLVVLGRGFDPVDLDFPSPVSYDHDPYTCSITVKSSSVTRGRCGWAQQAIQPHRNILKLTNTASAHWYVHLWSKVGRFKSWSENRPRRTANAVGNNRSPRRWIPFGGSTADGGGGGGAVGRPGATPRARPGTEQPLPAAIAPQRASAARAPASPGAADCCCC